MRWIRGVTMACCLTVLAGCAGMDLPGRAHRESAVTGKPVNFVESQLLEIQACMVKIDGAVVESQQDHITVTLRCDSVFDKDTARINSPHACGLDDLAEMLNKHAETKVKVEAHTDCMRSEEENLLLSETRASAVKDALVTKGVDGSRIMARGWGEAKPAASNATEEGRKVNRRITVTLLPRQG
ncbi:MAG: OmpA family protein [Syntrophobacter sp.]